LTTFGSICFTLPINCSRLGVALYELAQTFFGGVVRALLSSMGFRLAEAGSSWLSPFEDGSTFAFGRRPSYFPAQK
jgi:hypothetical protein